ncbi:hypothetical protein AV530_012945 [Patagioenas fasciata monilis]|uniref:Uncharacterized protein n=1 Tax=Patagioenas fasciata monilis TaxID=372326 RepID=A0A1V4JA06_PATFA|nr:hypothetical protein AV530_012945 [Patagioenas fasciata monilis]
MGRRLEQTKIMVGSFGYSYFGKAGARTGVFCASTRSLSCPVWKLGAIAPPEAEGKVFRNESMAASIERRAEPQLYLPRTPAPPAQAPRDSSDRWISLVHTWSFPLCIFIFDMFDLKL